MVVFGEEFLVVVDDASVGGESEQGLPRGDARLSGVE